MPATRIIIEESGQRRSVAATVGCAPERIRASTLSARSEQTEATPSRATTQGRREATGGEPDRTNRPDRTRLPALFGRTLSRIFRRN